MRNLLALFGAALLTVVGAGWYLGWYKVQSQPASVPGKTSVNIDINTNKISEDLHQGEQKLQHWLDNNKNSSEGKKADSSLMLPSSEPPQNSKKKNDSKS